MFCIDCPKHISIAVSYFLSTEIKLAKTPSTPLFRLESFSQANSKDLTLFIYPSLSFSVSCKNLHLDSFILYSAVKLLILLSYSLIAFIAFSFLSFISSSFFIALFLVLSISKKFFAISCFFILFESNSDTVICNSCFTFFFVFSKFSKFTSYVLISDNLSYLASVSNSTFFFLSSISNSFADNFSDNFASSSSFSFNSFSNFSLFLERFSLFDNLFSFSSLNSWILTFSSSISFCNLSILVELFEILSFDIPI